MLVAVVVGAELAFVLGAGIDNYVLDDAYIVEHAVSGILSGGETRFFDSAPWLGVTSYLYVAAVAVLSLLFPIELAHCLIGIVSGCLLVCGWYVLVFNRLNNALIAGVISVTCLWVGGVFWQWSNGLETALAMAALTWLLVAFDRPDPPNWGYALMGIQGFLRPELGALSLLMCLHLLAAKPAGYRRGLILTLAALIGCMLLLQATVGSIIPNTISAKGSFFAEGCQPLFLRLGFAAMALRGYIFDLGPFSLGFVLVSLTQLRWTLLAFVVAFFLAYALQLPGALFHNSFRYAYLLMPLAVFGWSAGLSSPYWTLRVCCMTLIIWVGITTVPAIEPLTQQAIARAKQVASDNTEMSKWVASHVPEDAVVMVHDAGRISQFGGQPLIDLVGLKSPYSAEVHRRMTYARCQRAPEAIAEIATHAHASYLVVTRDWDRVFKLTASLRAEGWQVERADAERGNTLYQVFSIKNTVAKEGVVEDSDRAWRNL